jgi:hypothetical protein
MSLHPALSDANVPSAIEVDDVSAKHLLWTKIITKFYFQELTLSVN